MTASAGRWRGLRRSACLAAILLWGLWWAPAKALAGTYTVDVLTDAAPTPRGVGTGSHGDLRYCITQANDEVPGTASTITFTVNGTITLSGHELVIDNDVTITGPGENQLTIDANLVSRVFYVAPGQTVAISNLTMTRGNGTGADLTGLDNEGAQGNGGAILNDGSDLTLSHCTISNSTSPVQYTDISRPTHGGGVFNSAFNADATLTVKSCTITGNTASDSYGSLSDGGGGGIENAANGGHVATVKVMNSTISNNTTNGKGGGIFNYVSSDGSALATVSDSTLSNNTAVGAGGGGLASTSEGYSSVVLTVTMTNCLIFGNTATNGAAGGGGILNGSRTGPADMTLTNCSIYTNNAMSAGGGGVCNNGLLGTPNLTVSRCTINGNMAKTNGGGILNYADYGTGTLNVDSSTIVLNTSATRGGGIGNLADPGDSSPSTVTAMITNCTIAGNSATNAGGGLSNDRPPNRDAASLTIGNSILALNLTGANYAGSNSTATSSGFNLSDDNTFNRFTPGTGDLINTPAGLQVDGAGQPLLKDHGGPTLTVGLLANSAAIDAGQAGLDPLTGVAAVTDQRGTARPIDKAGVANAANGDGSDIGALESGGGPVIDISAQPANYGSVSGGGQVEYGDTITVTATPGPGYFFINWTEGATVASTTKAYTFDAKSARTLLANFRVATPPSISIESPAGHPLSSGATTVDFGTTVVNGNQYKQSFVLKNTGESDLHLGAFSFTGDNAADFTVTSSPAGTVAGGGSSTFEVTYNPTSLVQEKAVLHLPSDTSGTASPFDLGLTATAMDSTAPTVKLTTPPLLHVTSPLNLTGTVSENFKLASFTVKLNGVTLALDAPVNLRSTAAQNWSVTGALPENGTNVLVIEAVDLGGRTSVVTKTFSFTNVRPALAGIFPALLVPSGAPTLATTGLVRISVMPTGSFTGKVVLGGTTVPIRGLLNNAGAARFFPAYGTTLELKTAKADFGAFALNVSAANGMTGTLSQASGAVAAFAGHVAPYRRGNLVPAAPYLNQPVGRTLTKGVYNVAFLFKAQTPAKDTTLYPQGDGYATVNVSNVGTVTAAGWLADGTSYGASGELRADGSVVLFRQLYGRVPLGALGGELTFSDLTNTDAKGDNFLWLRPLQGTLKTYPAGWPEGIVVDARGTKYASPSSLDFGQGAADLVQGNATMKFTDGLLVPAVMKPVSIDPATGLVKLIPAADRTYSLVFTKASGLLSGSFTRPDNTKSAFKGILLNKGANRFGVGYFLSTPTAAATGQSGGFLLDPAGP